MTAPNENMFRVAGPLLGESADDLWIPLKWPMTRSFAVFFDLLPNMWLSTQLLMIWDVTTLVMMSLLWMLMIDDGLEISKYTYILCWVIFLQSCISNSFYPVSDTL